MEHPGGHLGKAKRTDKEHSREQRLHRENAMLKRQVARLRNMLERANLDAERARELRHLVKLQYKEEREATRAAAEAEDKAARRWACRQCDQGRLRMTIITRRNGTFYWRACDSGCGNRTKMQKFHEGVEGDDGGPAERPNDGADSPQ